MNNFAINNLANMEFMLYGGKSGMNANCPSVYNGYMTQTNNNMMNYYNPIFRGYNNNNNYNNKDIFTQSADATRVSNPYQTAAEGSSQVDWNNPQFKGLTNDDMNKLADYYAKNNVLEEGFTGAAAGGLSWMAFEHAQSVFHPINAAKGIKAAEEMFKGLPKALAKENAALLQDAHIAVQQVVRDTGSKGWFSQWLRRPLYIDNQKVINEMKPAARQINQANKAAVTRELNAMKNAIETAKRTGDVSGIAEQTARLQALRGMDGKIAGPLSGGRKTVEQRLKEKTNKGLINSEKTRLLEQNKNVIKNKFGNLVVNSLKKDFVGFMAFEALFNAGKIMTAFDKDAKTGIEQTVQSAGKSASGAAGWCLGRAVGTWLGAKAGAAIGTAICPGAGTVAGALIGLTLGSIGMWLGHKIGNKVFGMDVADKVEAQKLAKTPEGQAQLLNFAMMKAQEGKADEGTNNIVYKALRANA